MSNGDASLSGSIHGRIKGLKQSHDGSVHGGSGHFTSSKGKGKSVASRKGKGVHAGAGSDDSLDGDAEDMADGQLDEEEEDDYIVRTDHLANPVEDVE